MSGYDTNTNKGAISLSINDIKFKFKFGLSLLLWQSDRRIPGSQSELFFNSTKRGSVIEDVNSTDPVTPASASYRYTILGGLFFEDCLITDYGRTINSSPTGPNIMESISVVYSDSKPIKKLEQSIELEDEFESAFPGN